MGGRNDNDYRRLADRHRAYSMNQSCPTDIGPPDTHVVHKRSEPRHDLFGVGLVLEERYFFTADRMVACCSAEQHNSATIRLDRPFIGSSHR